jgi:anti-anti-sigma factor
MPEFATEARLVDGLSSETPLSITTVRMSDWTIVVDVAGEIDLATSPQVAAALQESVACPIPPREIRVCLTRVTFIDARGISALVVGCQAARRAGVGFSVHNPQGIVRRVLDIVGLTDNLHVWADPL